MKVLVLADGSYGSVDGARIVDVEDNLDADEMENALMFVGKFDYCIELALDSLDNVMIKRHNQNTVVFTDFAGVVELPGVIHHDLVALTDIIPRGVGTVSCSSGNVWGAVKVGEQPQLVDFVIDFPFISDTTEVKYYGFDARVLADPDDPESDIVGVNGDPEFVLTIEIEGETFTKEDC